MRSTRSIARLAICYFVFALAVSPLSAQIPQRGDTTSTPIPGVGHNYVTSPVDIVNPANGALSIRIGVKMPSARGIQLPFSFAYDSNGTSYVAGSGGLGLRFLSASHAILARGLELLDPDPKCRKIDLDVHRQWRQKTHLYRCR